MNLLNLAKKGGGALIKKEAANLSSMIILHERGSGLGWDDDAAH